jgi:hypothetical protein
MSVTGNSDPVWVCAQTRRGWPTNLRSIFVFHPRLWKPARAVLRQLCRTGVESTALKLTAER